MKKIDRKMRKAVQGDLPVNARPYGEIGRDIGLTEKEVIEGIRMLLQDGTIRKFGAILRHQKAGYRRNAMIIWAVPDEEAERAGRILSSCREVTHCYERRPAFEGKYNLFTMVHFRDQEMGGEIRNLVLAAGTNDYRILESLEEFKKTSMRYF